MAGGACRVEPIGRWLAAVPREEWPDAPQELEEVLDGWDERFGDRAQEMVFIGRLDPRSLRDRLESCLLTEVELTGGYAVASRMEDPFTPWEFDETPAGN